MPDETTTIEDGRMTALNRSRQDSGSSAQSARTPAEPRVETMEALLIVGFALINDVSDLLIIGSIPVVGDIMDGITWFTIWLWAQSRGLKQPFALKTSGVIEFIPFAGDILPTYTFMALAIILYNNNPNLRAILGN